MNRSRMVWISQIATGTAGAATTLRRVPGACGRVGVGRNASRG